MTNPKEMMLAIGYHNMPEPPDPSRLDTETVAILMRRALGGAEVQSVEKGGGLYEHIFDMRPPPEEVVWDCPSCGYRVSDEKFKKASCDFLCRCKQSTLSRYRRVVLRPGQLLPGSAMTITMTPEVELAIVAAQGMALTAKVAARLWEALGEALRKIKMDELRRLCTCRPRHRAKDVPTWQMHPRACGFRKQGEREWVRERKRVTREVLEDARRGRL